MPQGPKEYRDAVKRYIKKFGRVPCDTPYLERLLVNSKKNYKRHKEKKLGWPSG